MRRSFRERLVVSLSNRVFDFVGKVLEEIFLPFSLLSRWARGKLPLWMAWDILRTTWAPFRIVRRWHGRYLAWKDRRYRGHDEFHPSLDMNVRAMLTMTEDEQEEYLADLCRRRQGQHEDGISRRT
jgi:hypothetical protein